MDGNVSLLVYGRANEGVDCLIISGVVAEKIVLNGVGKLRKIPPVPMKVPVGNYINNFQNLDSLKLSITFH